MLAEKWGLSADSPDLSWFIHILIVDPQMHEFGVGVEP